MSRKWLPYAPASMRGVWRSAENALPNASGAYYPPNIFAQVIGAAPATPGVTKRAWCALLPDDTPVGYVGTTTKLYVYDGATTLTDRSGAAYSGGDDWSFAQFGNISFATNRVDNIQSRDATTANNFANAGGSPPRSRIVLTQSDQVLLFDLNDGAEKPDAFATCAPGDHTDWSGAGATIATRIRHRPGKITAAIPFRDHVLVFKRSSVYRLTYTGNSTFKWKVELIAIGRGAWGKHDAVNCGDFVIFNGPSGAWSFDGASFTYLSDYAYPVGESSCAFYSTSTQNVYFMRGPNWGGASIAAYNLRSERWGYMLGQRTDAAFSSDNLRLIVGDPAAMAAFLGDPTTPDTMYLVDLGLNPCVTRSNVTWGDSGLAGGTMVLSGNIEGLGGREITTFGGLDVQYAFTNPAQSYSRPDSTELRLDIYCASSVDDASLHHETGLATPREANVSSSTAQRRFDFQVADVYARFRLKVPDTAGYVEIDDYAVEMTPSGEL